MAEPQFRVDFSRKNIEIGHFHFRSVAYEFDTHKTKSMRSDEAFFVDVF